MVPALRRSWDGRSPVSPAEDWEEWWAAVRAEPAFAAALAERDRRRHEHPRGDESDRYASHRDALAAAGFGEIGTGWQRADDRVLVAVR